jgi:hypothetical protein
MIYSELRNYLSQITDPDVVDLFDRSKNVLEQVGFDDWLDVMENAMGDFSSEGDDTLLDVMRQRLSQMFDSVLLAHGVMLNESAVLSDRVDILQALLAAIACEDKEELFQALERNHTDSEAFADVIAYASDLSAEKVLALIEEVSPDIVARLRELLSESEDLQMEDTQLEQTRLLEYDKYKIVFANDLRWCDKFAQFSQAVGLPFSSYAKLYMTQQFTADLTSPTDAQMAWRQICVNLIGISCLSEEGSIKAAELAKPYLEHISSDLGTITQVFNKFNDLLLEYNRAQT